MISRFKSQAGQDLFALEISGYKDNGTYLEIGAGPSQSMSNTYVLEKEYQWFGISIEKNKVIAAEFNLNRVNKCLVADATELDYQELLDSKFSNREIDYLSVDIEPAHQTLKALELIMLTDYCFKAITFEHDLYVSKENDVIKKSQKELLLSKGYTLYRENVCSGNNPKFVFEDWWIL